MRVATAVLFGVIGGPLVILMIVWGSGCAVVSVDKGKAVGQNEAVLDALHQYPGAKLVQDYSNGVPGGPSWNENGPPYTGYNTFRTYQLTHPVPATMLMAFFRRVTFPHSQSDGRQTCEANFISTEGVRVYVRLDALGCDGDASSYTLEIDQG
ncbi:MAG TPA: hypothetical protein VGH82_16540 [Gaiellaceae bacterium]|jgi:hypothetical protein